MRRLLNLVAVFGVLTATVGIGSAALSSAASAQTSTKPILVGGLGEEEVFPGQQAGFLAGIHRFNAAGGLDGRKIQSVGYLDDDLSPQTMLTDAQKLVLDDHVMVVAPVGTAVGTGAVGDVMAQNQVPFLGYDENAMFDVNGGKWGYGVNGDLITPNLSTTEIMQDTLKAMGDTSTPSKVKIAITAVDVPAAIPGTISAAKVAKHLGMTDVYREANIPETATDFTPFAQQLIASGANLVYEELTQPQTVGLAAALKAGGYKGYEESQVYLADQLSSNPSEASALSGGLVNDYFPVAENNSPTTQQEAKDLAATGSASQPMSVGESVGYFSALMLEQMLQATLKSVGGNPDAVTGAAIEKTVNKGFTYTNPLAGGIGPIYFPAAEKIPGACGTVIKDTGSSYKQVTPEHCTSVIDVNTGKTINLMTGKPES